MSTTTSIANLCNDTWTVSNLGCGIITQSLWLAEELRLHTEQMSAVLEEPVTVSYQLDGVDIDADLHEVREVLLWLQEHYRVAKRYDANARPARYALLTRLAESRVMPSDMAAILGVSAVSAERFAGSEHEARLARMILHRLRTGQVKGPAMDTANDGDLS
ncbi:MAG TPA: hypothetical protein VGP24_03930 [Glaciihabitans sp.]|jgi:hypothetical protein|nr:hypothetical protein [Glaciihabitans sp.]